MTGTKGLDHGATSGTPALMSRVSPTSARLWVPLPNCPSLFQATLTAQLGALLERNRHRPRSTTPTFLLLSTRLGRGLGRLLGSRSLGACGLGFRALGAYLGRLAPIAAPTAADVCRLVRIIARLSRS